MTSTKRKSDSKLKSSVAKNSLLGLTLMPLAACGGGGGTVQPTPTPPPAPEPDFIESPTNTFTARDDNDRTLQEGSATADLIVIGKAGNDNITTGTGDDVITAGRLVRIRWMQAPVWIRCLMQGRPQA
ncbi:hypothetical protein [Paremcibacter congregatus]|nr:hypothetical protein [Paremcibacter congregatus]QDE27800.1 hypothetical protein FIV45_11195 [Paremcibacter congregatus]